MNPFAIVGIVAGIGAGLAIATRKRNAAEAALADYWRRVAVGEDPTTVLEGMLGSPGNLPDDFATRRAEFIVARGRPGRNQDMDDPYQGRFDPHWGQDIVAAIGTPIHAAKSGIVTYAENRIAGFGRMIWVSHLDQPISTFYAHLDGFSVGLGQLVEGDEQIGFVGNTCAPEGTVPPCWCRQQPRCAQLNPPQESRTMGAHLHFEVHTSRIPNMNVRNSLAAGRRECLEPVTWLEENGIRVVGELV